MLYRELTPAPVLRPYIRCYWTLRAEATGGGSPQRVLPDGCVEIVINLGARFVRHDESGRTERQPRELVVGPTTRHVSIAPTGAIGLVGIRFAPGGAVPFLSVAPQEVRDAAPSLADVAPPLEASVVERLAAAPSGAEAPILDAALGARLSRARRVPDHRVLASVRATSAADRPLRVDFLTSLTGLGARQLGRVFRDNVGFGPKTLCRLVRFQRVVRSIEPAARAPWARLAAQHGYADQSHLAREFRDFAGTTLTSYVGELHPMSDHFHDAPGADDAPLG
jgi:AraC-like DNA-binding protein